MVEGVKIVAPWPLILALFLRQISFLKKNIVKNFWWCFFANFGCGAFCGAFRQNCGVFWFKTFDNTGHFGHLYQMLELNSII